MGCAVDDIKEMKAGERRQVGRLEGTYLYLSETDSKIEPLLKCTFNHSLLLWLLTLDDFTFI